MLEAGTQRAVMSVWLKQCATAGSNPSAPSPGGKRAWELARRGLSRAATGAGVSDNDTDEQTGSAAQLASVLQTLNTKIDALSQRVSQTHSPAQQPGSRSTPETLSLDGPRSALLRDGGSILLAARGRCGALCRVVVAVAMVLWDACCRKMPAG